MKEVTDFRLQASPHRILGDSLTKLARPQFHIMEIGNSFIEGIDCMIDMQEITLITLACSMDSEIIITERVDSLLTTI